MSDKLAEFVVVYEEAGDIYEIDDTRFGIVNEGEWTQDHKNQYQTTIVLFDGDYFSIDQSRTGSYHTDWFYRDTYIQLVERKTETRVIETWEPIGAPFEIPSKY